MSREIPPIMIFQVSSARSHALDTQRREFPNRIYAHRSPVLKIVMASCDVALGWRGGVDTEHCAHIRLSLAWMW